MDDELLKYALKNDIIDMAYLKEKVDMNKRQKIISAHPYSIWKGTDGKWYTYLHDEKKGRVLRKRTSKEAIYDMIVENSEEQQCKEQKREAITFKNVYDKWREMQISYGISNNTLNKYKYDYKRYFNETNFERTDIRDITSKDVELFVINNIKMYRLKEKASKSLIGYIFGVFRYAVIDRIISANENPCQFVDSKKFKKFYNTECKSVEERTISGSQLTAIIRQIKEDNAKKPEYMPAYAIELAMLTGMRPGELAGLAWKNVYLDEGFIRICMSEKFDRETGKYYIDSTKNKKCRIFPISNEIRDLFGRIDDVQNKFGICEDFVFSTSKGRYHGRTISDYMRNKCIQVGIETKCIYSIRRTFNSKMRCNGVSATIASSLLGHTEEVNNGNYTYDISDMDYKRDIIASAGREMITF